MKLDLRQSFRKFLENRIGKSQAILSRYKDTFPDHIIEPYRNLCRTTTQRERASKIVHLGCGRDLSKVFSGDWFSDLFIVGVDLDISTLSQYQPGEKVQANLEHLPFCDGSLDVSFCEMVFEHLERPSWVASEIARILRPCGLLIFATPNRYAYPSLIARFSPYKFHLVFHRLMNPVKSIEDGIFPTYYQLNSRSVIKEVLTKQGFKEELLLMVEGKPWLLRFSPTLTRIGIWYHRLLLRHQALSGLRSLIVGVYRRME